MDKKKNKEINLFPLILKDESSGLNVEGDNDIYWIFALYSFLENILQ